VQSIRQLAHEYDSSPFALTQTHDVELRPLGDRRRSSSPARATTVHPVDITGLQAATKTCTCAERYRRRRAEQQAGLDAQIRDLKAAGCEEVFSEQVSAMAQRVD
jgi:hypothetical protein